MNHFRARITKIEACNRLHQVSLKMQERELTIVTLELPEGVREGAEVTLLVKPTHILLSTASRKDLSFDNRLQATVSAIEKGEILTTVQLACAGNGIEAIITTRALERLQLQNGQTCFVYINAATFSIGKSVDV